MCIAIPGKVVEISDTDAKVDFNGNIVKVNIGLGFSEGGSVCSCTCRMCHRSDGSMTRLKK